MPEPGSTTPESSPPEPAAAGGAVAGSTRLASLDAYRGLAMLLLAFTVPNWGWQHPLYEAYPESSWVAALLDQTEHAAWRGITVWDMIQPSFMFMVGVSMTYSYSSRRRKGASDSQLLRHAAGRAIALILLGVFLRSLGQSSTNWTLEDVVSQIGLGYVPLYLLWRARTPTRIAVAAGLLAATWALYAAWPLPADSYNTAANKAAQNFEGFWAHWNKNANPGHYLDQVVLNWFPRAEPFQYNSEGYNTLNFVPSLVVMILGLIAGDVLRQPSASRGKLARLAIGGLLLIALGVAADASGICPLVKKVWTPAFSLLSGGLCLWLLALLYFVIDVRGLKAWAYPAIIVGMNPLAMYCMTWMIAGWTQNVLQTHLGRGAFAWLGEPSTLLLGNLATGAVLWLICCWMHNRRIYLRL